jgi:thiamine pyrophosphate-dependent acetolactate synthase large subunit-like protein
MGASALWTAANLGLPLLVVVCANGVYGNDVVHQERVARARGRDVGNRWVGQMLNRPELGIAQIALGLGAVAAERIDEAAPGLEAAVARLGAAAQSAGGVAVLEVMMPAR